ncbi:MAG TPA: hypothetical protein VN845_09280, partial [Solirubrobacteraceae bacterium]|nr:hypothetical protein [Solirubrobacteraceae bacterium]
MTRNRLRFLVDWGDSRAVAMRVVTQIDIERLVWRAAREPQHPLKKVGAILAARLGRSRVIVRAGTVQTSLDVRPGIRVLPVLRAAHLEEIDAFAPRMLLYFRRNYDMQGIGVPGHVTQVTLLQACRRLVSCEDEILELHEPLWIEYFLAWCVLAFVWKTVGLLRRRRRVVVFFAIENNSAVGVLSRGRRWLRPAARVAVPVVRAVVSSMTWR